MSSVQDYKECPQCKGMYITDFNCRTTEETRKCFRCGRSERWFIKRDEQGKAVLNGQGQLQLEYECNDGCGAMQLAQKNGFAQVWTFHEPVSEEIKEFYQETLKDEAINEKNSYLTSWDEEKSEVVALYGEVPPTYGEIMGGEEQQDTDE